MPKIEKVAETYNGVSIECAKITIDKAGQSYRFSNVFDTTSELNMADDYAWQMVAKSNANRSITLTVGDKDTTFSLTNTFARYTNVFYGVKPSTYPYVELTFPSTGLYWFYHVQLEHGNTVTDWHSETEDAVIIANENTTQVVKKWTTFYDTKFEKTDNAILLNARAIIANENNIAEVKSDMEASLSIQADQIKSAVSDIEVLDHKVEQYNSDIVQRADNIAASVTAMSQDINQNYYSKASIDMKADSITSEVSRTYSTKSETSDAINGINIGGTNLLLGTKDFNKWNGHSSVTLSDDSDGTKIATFNAVTTLAWRGWQAKPPIQYSVIRDKTITFSMYIRSNVYNSWASLSSDYGWMVVFCLCTESSETRTLYFNAIPKTQQMSSSWIKVTQTVDASDDKFEFGSGTINNNTRFYIQIYNYSLLQMQVKQVKLEIGNKATDWSPAPRDLENYADAAATAAVNNSTPVKEWSTINQTISGISTEVGKKVGYNEIISRINQSAESISIDASKINLTGYVTFSNLSGVQSSSNITTIDGSHITTGKIQDANKNVIFDLTNGQLDVVKGSIKLGKNDDGSYKFTVNNNGALVASNATINGGSITIKNGNVTTFNVSNTGNVIIRDKDNNPVLSAGSNGASIAGSMNITGTLRSSNGNFTVDDDGNIYANSIHLRTSGTGTSTSKDILYIGAKEDGLPDGYDNKTLVSETMISKHMIAKDIMITGGSVLIDAGDVKTVDGLYSYISLKYKWAKTNWKYDRTTTLTSSGVTTTLTQQYGTQEDGGDFINQTIKLYDHGISASYDQKNTLTNPWWIRRGSAIDIDKIRLYLDNTDVFSAYVDGLTKETNITIGCDAASAKTESGYSITARSDTLTTVHGNFLFSAVTKVFIGGISEENRFDKWFDKKVDTSAHEFTGQIIGRSTFQLTKTISNTKYNVFSAGINTTTTVYTGQIANIVIGRGDASNPTGATRFLDSVTLPNGNPISVVDGTGTRVYDGTTLRTLKEFVETYGGGSSDSGFTNEYKNYIDALANTSSTSGVSRINLGSSSNIYIANKTLQELLNDKMSSQGSSGTVNFKGTTALSGVVYIPTDTYVGTTNNSQTLTAFVNNKIVAKLTDSISLGGSGKTVTLNGTVNIGSSTLAQYIKNNQNNPSAKASTNITIPTFTGASITTAVFAKYGNLCFIYFAFTKSQTGIVSASVTISDSNLIAPAKDAVCGICGYDNGGEAIGGHLTLSTSKKLDIRISKSSVATAYLRGVLVYCSI